MCETAAELVELQALIDRSHARAKPHMAGIIHPGKYSLSAAQVVKLFDGMKTIAVAAPAPNGDPLVGPMDGLAQLNGVHDLTATDGRVQFDVDTDEINPVLRRLTEIGVRSLVSQPPSLEELFLRLYEPEAVK